MQSDRVEALFARVSTPASHKRLKRGPDIIRNATTSTSTSAINCHTTDRCQSCAAVPVARHQHSRLAEWSVPRRQTLAQIPPPRPRRSIARDRLAVKRGPRASSPTRNGPGAGPTLTARRRALPEFSKVGVGTRENQAAALPPAAPSKTQPHVPLRRTDQRQSTPDGKTPLTVGIIHVTDTQTVSLHGRSDTLAVNHAV